MSEKIKPSEKKGESLASLLSRALLGHPINGLFKEGDGYVNTRDGMAFDSDTWERAHPGKKWEDQRGGSTIDSNNAGY